MPRRLLSIALPLCCFAFLFSAGAAEPGLEDGFREPPDSAKPRTWWHWVSGNVSAEGITADLQAMKQVGLGGAQIFTVDQSAVKGPIGFMSPEWRQLVHQALTEADQLKLEIAMEGCDGWSESGGHWVEPAQSMQQAVWTERNVTGGEKIALDLPQPLTVDHYYEDIALFAFPTLAGDDLPAPAELTASAANFPGEKLRQTPAGTARLENPHPGQPLWVACAFAGPVTCRSLLVTTRRALKSSGELQVSDDGTNFRKVCPISPQGSFGFPAATGKFFRLWFPQVPATSTGIEFTGIKFRGARVDDIEARTGLKVNANLRLGPAAFSPEDLIDPKALLDLTGKTEWDAPPGKWTVVRMGHTSTGATTHPSTTPGLECDKLSRVAVDAHIRQMYGPVFADSPAQVGRSFRYLLLDSWEAGCENWTPLMRGEFQRRRGYDLWPWLPALTGRLVQDAETTERFLWDYRRTLADLVADNHYGAFQAAAHQRGMGLYAEATGIGLPTVADQLQCKGRTDIPMGEFWVNQRGEGNVDDPKEAASAAHIYGGNIAATESFTSVPATAAWTNDPYSLKMEGDKEFCLGVNRFVFHRYAHQPWLDRWPGMSMGPWGINFERTNTWWSQGSAWISYLSRCEYLLQRGRFAADLCYFYGEGAPVSVQHERLKPAVPHGCDYDVCNAEILLGQMSVRDGQIALQSGMRYRVLVLPDTDRMTLPVLRKIQALVTAGAVVYGPKPVRSPSLSDAPAGEEPLRAIAQEVWGDCDGKKITEHACGQGRVVWGQPLAAVLAVPPDFEAGQKNLLDIHRVDGDADLYFVSNQQSRAVETECTFRVAGKIPELWHPDTGKIETAAIYRSADGRTTLPVRFDPSGSVFVVFRQPETGADHPVSLVRDDPGASVSARHHLEILHAIYGAANGAGSMDVTAALTARVQDDMLDVEAGNAVFGHDPAPMTAKQLQVDYSLGGRHGTQTVPEGETLFIGAAEAARADAALFVDARHGLELQAARAGTYHVTMAGGETRSVSVPVLPEPMEITGAWTLDFPPKWGAPGQVSLDRLMSWTDHPDPGVRYFSGTAAYHAAVNVPADFVGAGRRVYLDLGEVKNLAEVALNGTSLGILWKPPFRVDVTDALKGGSNQLEVKVTNLWPNRLIGDLQLPEEQRLTWTSVSLYKKDAALLPSGLLGPVKLIPGQTIPVPGPRP